MSDYPYVNTTGKLREFIVRLQTVGIPPVLDLKFVKGLGFKSSNHERFPSVLKAIGFADSSGKPTESWNSWRDTKNGPKILAGQLKQAYGPLFQMHPSAHESDREALMNFFRSGSNLGDQALGRIVDTFKVLSGLAEFDGLPTAAIDTGPGAGPSAPRAPVVVPPTTGSILQGVTVNVQLTLPETTNLEIYENIFKAMRKYLLGEE